VKYGNKQASSFDFGSASVRIQCRSIGKFAHPVLMNLIAPIRHEKSVIMAVVSSDMVAFGNNFRKM
jgi:hypothetical protein